MSNYKKNIVVMGSMESEYQVLEAALSDPVESSMAGYRFVQGSIDEQPVVAVRSHVGMNHAAIVTTLAIREFEPVAVIFQGTAGSHNIDLHQGDIILGQNIVNIASYLSKHREPGEGSDFTEWDYPGIELKIEVGGICEPVAALHSDATLLKIAKEVAYEHGNVITGTIGSGDVWNREIDKINFLHEHLGTDCEEMEGEAVAQVCQRFDIPVLGIRIISNSELHPEEEFSHVYGWYCQEYVLDVIRSIAAQN